MSSLPTVKFPFHQVHGTRHLLPHHVPPSTSSHLPLRRPCLLLAASVSTSRPCRICKLFFSFFTFFPLTICLPFLHPHVLPSVNLCHVLRHRVLPPMSPCPAPTSHPRCPRVTPVTPCPCPTSASSHRSLVTRWSSSLCVVPPPRPPLLRPHVTTPAFPTSQPLRSPCHPLHPRVMPPVSRRPRPLNTSTPGSSTPMLPVPHPHPCPS